MRWRFRRLRLQGETPNRVDVSGGLDGDDRLAGDSSGVKVTNRVGNVFEVDGSIDDRHDSAAGEVVAQALEDRVVLLVDEALEPLPAASDSSHART